MARNVPFSTSVEVSFAFNDETAPTNNLYRPGKTVSKFLYAGGRHIDKYLSKGAELVGYGPRVTAVKIARRQRTIKHFSLHQRGLDPQNCLFCREQVVCSSTSVGIETEKLTREAKKLLNYVTSNVPSTRRQAAEHVLDLSVRYEDVRTIFKQLDAIKIIHDSTRIYSEFRLSDSDDILLSASRKALISLRDTQVNAMLQDWTRMLSSSRNLEKRLDSEDYIPPWRRIAEFLICTQDSWGCLHYLTEVIMGDIGSCIANTTRYFEWDNFEDIFDSTISGTYSSIAKFDGSLRSIAFDYIFRFAATTPQILRTRLFQKLLMNVDELGPDFETVCLLKGAVMRTFEHVEEEFGKIPSHLQGFRDAFACPLDRAVCDCIWDSRGSSFVYHPFTMIGCYIDCIDPILRTKAWRYANYYLDSDLYSCDGILNALTGTSFPASVDFDAFKKEKRSKHVPRKGDGQVWKIICRFVDKKNGHLHLVEEKFLPPDITNVEYLRYTDQWILAGGVVQDEAFAEQGLHPLLAGHNEVGERTYIARLVYRPFMCSACVEWGWVSHCFIAATEGMKPEDLRVEISCPHKTQLFIPKWMEVLFLKYPPADYPDSFSLGKTAVDATGPFSWRRFKRQGISTNSLSMRIMPATEAEELGLVADADEGGSLSDYDVDADYDRQISDSDDIHLDSEVRRVESYACDEVDEVTVDHPTSISYFNGSDALPALDINSWLEDQLVVHPGSVRVETSLDGEESSIKEVGSVYSSESNDSSVTATIWKSAQLDEPGENDRDGCEAEIYQRDSTMAGTGDVFDLMIDNNSQLFREMEERSPVPKRELCFWNDTRRAAAASDWRFTLTVSIAILFGILLTRLYDSVRAF